MGLKNVVNFNGDVVFKILSEKIKYSWEEYVVLIAKQEDQSPFAVLLAIILSQNTNDKNSIKAYKELKKVIGIDIKNILNTDIKKLGESIKSAGMYNQKARTIKVLAERLEEAGGEKFLLNEPPEKVRDFLLKIPGIGKKTADVFLSVYRGAPYFAVDTHAIRIARRWKLVDNKAKYDNISSVLIDFFGKDRVEEAHRLLIALGRRYCKARKPRCKECPLREICPYAQRSL